MSGRNLYLASNPVTPILWAPACMQIAKVNLHGASIDVDLNLRAFDLTTSGGFVTLGETKNSHS